MYWSTKDMPHAPSSAGPTPEQVLAALDRTGFILEYRVAQLLREYSDDVLLNYAFEDPESGKSREIDVYAARNNSIDTSSGKVSVSAILMIECKNYKDPLLVIGEGNQTRYLNDNPIITFDPLLYEFPSRPPRRFGGISLALGLDKLPYLSRSGFIGSQIIKMHRRGDWQATNEGVHDSIIYPLWKSAEYELQQIENTCQNQKRPWEDIEIAYIHPVLVTSGTVLAVDVSVDSAPTVTQVGWAPVVHNFADGVFLLDVVTFDSLAGYVYDRIYPVVTATTELLRPKLEFYDPVWLISEYGKPLSPNFDKWLKSSAKLPASDVDG